MRSPGRRTELSVGRRDEAGRQAAVAPKRRRQGISRSHGAGRGVVEGAIRAAVRKLPRSRNEGGIRVACSLLASWCSSVVAGFWIVYRKLGVKTGTALRLRHATASVFHQRHLGRVLRSSRDDRGGRLASSRDGEPRPGRCSSLWPSDLRNDGSGLAPIEADGGDACLDGAVRPDDRRGKEVRRVEHP